MRKLKQFSYYSQVGKDKGCNYYIMATSQKQVIEMFETINKSFSINDIRDFFYKAWGNDGNEIMKDIEITEPCIYMVKRDGRFGKFITTPERLV